MKNVLVLNVLVVQALAGTLAFADEPIIYYPKAGGSCATGYIQSPSIGGGINYEKLMCIKIRPELISYFPATGTSCLEGFEAMTYPDSKTRESDGRTALCQRVRSELQTYYSPPLGQCMPDFMKAETNQYSVSLCARVGIDKYYLFSSTECLAGYSADPQDESATVATVCKKIAQSTP